MYAGGAFTPGTSTTHVQYIPTQAQVTAPSISTMRRRPARISGRSTPGSCGAADRMPGPRDPNFVRDDIAALEAELSALLNWAKVPDTLRGELVRRLLALKGK